MKCPRCNDELTFDPTDDDLGKWYKCDCGVMVYVPKKRRTPTP